MTKHPCARCGKKQHADLMVFSRFSRKRYCGDYNACAKRAIRVKKVTA